MGSYVRVPCCVVEQTLTRGVISELYYIHLYLDTSEVIALHLATDNSEAIRMTQVKEVSRSTAINCDEAMSNSVINVSLGIITSFTSTNLLNFYESCVSSSTAVLTKCNNVYLTNVFGWNP